MTEVIIISIRISTEKPIVLRGALGSSSISAVNALFNTPLNLRKLLTATHFLMPSQISVYP